MIAEKCAPLLPSWLLGANMPHVLLDGALADMKAQFQQFSAHPLCTPESILFRHLPDQGDGFLGDLGLARSGLGLALPIQTEEFPMPPEQGLWLHDQEDLLPGSNQCGQQNEQDAIGVGACRPFHLPPEDDKLLAQEGIFRDQFGLASAKIGYGLQRQRGQERFGPTSQARGEGMQAVIQEALESGENSTHRRRFSIT
jgi:hypothetical protein